MQLSSQNLYPYEVFKTVNEDVNDYIDNIGKNISVETVKLSNNSSLKLSIKREIFEKTGIKDIIKIILHDLKNG